ncbi:carboxylate-amine ligase [Marivibrio halodurans]|uniref:Putative glutamate--cysteine ligase 2 n=1 Tax=Marivibrio halodurans TaxID=2039722 RepID=A0A8J7S235_9PROT|nr:carboxylate-amine ligase [Marivibrio halodurans]MBP5857249.1 carboxylate-amine ligase [Marivibrio halodurans]
MAASRTSGDGEDFTIGIEEEYLLVDPATGDLAGRAEVQEAVIEEVGREIDESIGAVTPEFLKAQVEVGTAVCRSIGEVREKLARLRGAVATAARNQGLAAVAASTHPTAQWASVQHTDKERYNMLANDLQGVARRLVISGMHVHVGFDDDEHRMDLLGQIAYFLPHLLALSTSSPFWQGSDTGLKCYRLAVFDELPRTGLPERFESWSEYARHVQILVDAGLMEDASKIWWDVRAHWRFPTIEMRIPDICTRMEDGIAIAALYACLLSMLQRLRRSNQRWRIYSNMLIQENRWRAQRYGFDEGLVDFGVGRIGAFDGLIEEILELTRPDQERLGCVRECEHARTILARGTSAHNQLRVFNEALAAGADKQAALKAVVDWLILETVADL